MSQLLEMRSYYEAFDVTVTDSPGEFDNAEGDWEPDAQEQWRTPKGGTGGVSSDSRDVSEGDDSGWWSSAKDRRAAWDGWNEDGSWAGSTPDRWESQPTADTGSGSWKSRSGRRWRDDWNENWSWKTPSEQGDGEGSWATLGASAGRRLFADEGPDDRFNNREPEDQEDPKGKVKIAGESRKGGKISTTYPPVFRARPQESYLEWKRSVEFWIGGEGDSLPVELIGPRMMVQLKDRASQLVKHLTNADVNGCGGKEVIFKALERAPIIRQLDRHRVDEHRRRLMQLSRAPGESMESYVTRAGIYRSHLIGIDSSLEMGEAFYIGHLLDHARLTRRDKAMVKTKAGADGDEEKITNALIDLAAELDGENGYPLGASEPNIARNGEEWLLQRGDRRHPRVTGQPRGTFAAEHPAEGSILEEEDESGAEGGEEIPPELAFMEHEAFGMQYKARQRINEVKKMRQFYRKPDGNDKDERKRLIAEQMKVRPCHSCGQLGHWSRECPNPQPKPAQAVLAASSSKVVSNEGPVPGSEQGEWDLLLSLYQRGQDSERCSDSAAYKSAVHRVFATLILF